MTSEALIQTAKSLKYKTHEHLSTEERMEGRELKEAIMTVKKLNDEEGILKKCPQAVRDAWANIEVNIIKADMGLIKNPDELIENKKCYDEAFHTKVVKDRCNEIEAILSDEHIKPMVDIFRE